MTSTVVSGACLRAFVRLSWIIRYALRPIASGACARSPIRLCSRTWVPVPGASSTSDGRSTSVGWGGSGWRVGLGGAQDAEDLAQVGQGAVRVDADHLGRLGHLGVVSPRR